MLRMQKPRLSWLGGLVVITTLATVPESSDAYQLEVGKVHPDFVLPRIDTGEPVTLSQFRGKKVLLLHFASW